MITRTLAVLTLTVAAFAQASAQTYDLSPRFKAGDKIVYDLTFDIEGVGQEMIYKAKIRNEIIGVKDDGEYSVISYQTDEFVIVDGVKQSNNAQELNAVTTYDKYGTPTAIGGDLATGESFRVANLTSFIAPEQPIEVGKSWTIDIPADAKNGTRKIVHTYRLLKIVKLKGHDVAEIQPASAYGKVWIDVKTGNTIKYQVEVKNMPVGDQYVNGKVLIELE